MGLRFDFYAPSSFRTEDDRLIQIGWMGMPDCPEHTNHTLADGWQHCFTFPREITEKDGILLQNPVRELEEKKELVCTVRDRLRMVQVRTFEVDAAQITEADSGRCWQKSWCWNTGKAVFGCIFCTRIRRTSPEGEVCGAQSFRSSGR